MSTDIDDKDTPMENTQDAAAEMTFRQHLLAARAAASQQASQSPPNHQEPHQITQDTPPPQQHLPDADDAQPSSGFSQTPRQPPQAQMQVNDNASQQQSSNGVPRQQIKTDEPQPPPYQQYPGSLDPQIAAHAAQYGYPQHAAGSLPQPASGIQHIPVTQQQAAMAAMSPSPTAIEEMGMTAKQKRELTNSKRAAQNRAAQRAFRQRKESYIKKLEDDVRNASALPALQENFQRVQQENFHMRDYIMHLQSKLLDVTGEFPPPPPTLELRDPRSGEPIQTRAPEVSDGQGGPPPLPQPGSGGPSSGAPVASMGLVQEGPGGQGSGYPERGDGGGYPERGDGGYPDQGAVEKVGGDSAQPDYKALGLERPSRPPPPPEGTQSAAG